MRRFVYLILIIGFCETILAADSSEHHVQPLPTIPFRDELVKLDHFGDATCEEFLARMDNAIINANSNPKSQLFVFVYEGRQSEWQYDRKTGKSVTRLVLPQVGLAKARINSMDAYLELKSNATNFVFVEGGLRENFEVEIYVVPPDSRIPSPSPSLKSIKYRKGKPQGFCLGCC